MADRARHSDDVLVNAFLDALEFERHASPRTIALYARALQRFRTHPIRQEDPCYDTDPQRSA